MPGDPVTTNFDVLLREAAVRVRNRIRALMPLAENDIERWLEQLTNGATLEAYFTHPRAFPTLMLPRWLAETAGRPLDRALETDLIYSTMQGYLAIRLVDDVMDGDARANGGLLPACAVFHAEFHSAYQRHFPPEHTFWTEFERCWAGTADAAIADAALTEIDLDVFREVTARKTCAGLIPLAAAGHATGLGAVPSDWRTLFSRLAEWHQMRNDFFDWRRDLERGAVTYVLSEAVRLRSPGESPEAWMIREGVRAGLSLLWEHLRAAQRAADKVGSASARAHLVGEQDELARMEPVIDCGLRAASQLVAG